MYAAILPVDRTQIMERPAGCTTSAFAAPDPSLKLSRMSIERVLNSRPARVLRDAAGTVRAVMFLGGVLVVVAGLAFTAATYVGTDSGLIVGAIVGASLGVAGIATVWYAVARYYDPPYYEILEIEGSLAIETFDHHHRYLYVKRQTVRALRNDLRLVEFKAHWTGRGSIMDVRPLINDHVVLDSVAAEEDGRVYRWIYPGGPVGRGQTFEVGLRQTHDDDHVRQKPYYRDGGGRYKTKRLTIVVKFPVGHEPHPVDGAVWNTRVTVGHTKVVGKMNYTRTIDHSSGTANYSMTVDRPKRYHSYGFRWNWPDNSTQ
jgi:hypothetical protein